MRLTLRFLGLELLALESEQDCDESDDPGECTTYPVGFTAHHDVPLEVDTPDRDW